MFNIDKTIFVLLLFLSASAYAKTEDQKYTLKNGWRVEITSKSKNKSILTIFKNNKSEFSKNYETGFGHIELQMFDDEDNYTKDIIGTGTQDIIVNKWTGGASCCTELEIFSLGRTVKRIADINVGKGDFEVAETFEDVDNNGTFEINLRDQTFSYWRTSGAASAYPEVIFEYQEDFYKLSVDLMKKSWTEKSPSEQKQYLNDTNALAQYIYNELEELSKTDFKIENWVNGESEDMPPELWSVMLDFLYWGQEDLAMEFLNKAWYEKLNGKEIFLTELKKQLLTSPYVSVVKEMNPKFFKP